MNKKSIIMDNIILKRNNTCRTCLCEASDCKSLLSKVVGDDRTLCEVLSFVTSVDISICEEYPKQVCNECHTMIYKADDFKKRFIQSESILKSGIFTSHFSELIKNEIITVSQLPIDNQLHDNYASYIKKSENLDTEKSINTFGLSSDDYKYENSIKEERDDYLQNDIDDFPDSIVIENTHLPVYTQRCICNFVAVDRSEFEIHTKECKMCVEKDNVIKLLCPTCNENFSNLDLLQIHINNHKENLDGKYEKCPKCKKKFENRTLLIAHMKTHKNKIKDKHKKSKNNSKNCKNNSKGSKNNSKDSKNNSKNSQIIPLKCSQCKEQFPNLDELTIHMKVHVETKLKTEEKNFQCSMCMRKFVHKLSLISHIKRHEDKKQTKYTCKACKREFHHRAHLDNHINLVHSKEKGISCNDCGKSFSTQDCLDLHMESHKVDKKHQCKVCNKTFTMLSTLTEHMRTHTGEKPFLCSICGRGFSQKNNLVQHIMRHQGLKPFKCEHCEHRFVSKGELHAHQRKHSGAHPFVCDECGSSFTTSSSLTKHRRIHSGERPYACDLCSMRFAVLGTLKNHRRTHTGEKPYKCSHCKKAFIQRNDLVSHIRCHTGERPFICTSCGQAFRKASALKVHIKIHAKEPMLL